VVEAFAVKVNAVQETFCAEMNGQGQHLKVILLSVLQGIVAGAVNDDTNAIASLTQRFQRLIQRSGQG